MLSVPTNNNTHILRMFPNIRSLYFNISITSPIDFRGLEKIESLSFMSVTVPIDLSPLINLKYILINSDISSFNNIKESLKELTKLKYVSLNGVPLTPIQLREYGIIYDTSHQSERDDILKDYIYDDEDYEIRDGAVLPS